MSVVMGQTHILCYIIYVSCIKCHVSPFTSHLSPIPTATSTDIPLLTPPICTLDWIAITQPKKTPKEFKTQTNKRTSLLPDWIGLGADKVKMYLNMLGQIQKLDNTGCSGSWYLCTFTIYLTVYCLTFQDLFVFSVWDTNR